MAASARHELMMFPPCPDGDLAALWTALGMGDGPSSRDQILALTMCEVAQVGPAAFNTRTVCARLNLTHPVIQYHFGSRDALIAEAGHRIYVRYVDRLYAAVEVAPRTPTDRLRAALAAGVELSREIRGWGAVLNYFPLYSDGVAAIVAERFQARHRQQYERNIALLVRLVSDVWQGAVSEVPADVDPADVTAGAATVLADPAALAAFSRLSFAAHGLAVWRAGHVLASGPGSDDSRAAEELADMITRTTIDDLVLQVAASAPAASAPS